MTSFDRAIEMAMTVVLIVGGYQFYFWAQRRRWFAARCLETRFDAHIAYDPRWVWVYSGLYYPMIIIAAPKRQLVPKLRDTQGPERNARYGAGKSRVN